MVFTPLLVYFFHHNLLWFWQGHFLSHWHFGDLWSCVMWSFETLLAENARKLICCDKVQDAFPWTFLSADPHTHQPYAAAALPPPNQVIKRGSCNSVTSGANIGLIHLPLNCNYGSVKHVKMSVRLLFKMLWKWGGGRVKRTAWQRLTSTWLRAEWRCWVAAGPQGWQVMSLLSPPLRQLSRPNGVDSFVCKSARCCGQDHVNQDIKLEPDETFRV